MGKAQNSVMVAARIPAALARRLEIATRGPLAPGKSRIIARGLEIILRRIEARKRKVKQDGH